jgi:hypothetical protein
VTFKLSTVRLPGALIAAALVAVCAILVGPAGAASRPACTAKGPQPSTVGSGNNFLMGVAATSTCNAWAVGYYHKGVKYLTLIEHWNGKAWKIQASPSPGVGSRIMSVTAPSASDAWAVGSTGGGSLIEHWNGKTWKIQPSPNGVDGGQLTGVAATSATNVWAVGSTGGGSLIEHWNGKAWKIQPSPCPRAAHECALSGVTATSATNAWAVGYDYNASDTMAMLVEHWNGKAWKIQPSPNPQGSNGGALSGVSATSATNAWAVGAYQQVGFGVLTFIEHWNGKAWKVQQSPNPGGGKGSGLNSVVATSATNAWAVGDIDFTNSAGKTLIERWNGKAWKVQPSPNPGSKSNALDGVAATSDKNAWAVGVYHDATPKPPARNLALRFNGSSWVR